MVSDLMTGVPGVFKGLMIGRPVSEDLITSLDKVVPVPLKLGRYEEFA